MSEILSIAEMKKLSTPVIEIPGFDNESKIKVRVRKPNILTMFSQGKIPNHLLSVATTMVGGNKSNPKKDEEERNSEVLDMLELYCTVCLVEPTYDEFKEIITDQQKEAIFEWGMGEVAEAATFRNEKEVQPDNNDGEALPEKA